MKITMATKKALVGRTIVDFDLGVFPDGRGGDAYCPRLTLDDGSVLTFTVRETESLEYGVMPILHKK